METTLKMLFRPEKSTVSVCACECIFNDANKDDDNGVDAVGGGIRIALFAWEVRLHTNATCEAQGITVLTQGMVREKGHLICGSFSRSQVYKDGLHNNKRADMER